MTFQNKAQFFKTAQNLQRVTVNIEGFGTITLQELSGRAMTLYREKIKGLGLENGGVDSSKAVELTAYLITLSACDENGDLLFTEDDVTQLTNISFHLLKTLADRVMSISGIDVSAKKSSEAIENLKKAPAFSTSDLPTNLAEPLEKSKRSRRRK